MAPFCCGQLLSCTYPRSAVYVETHPKICTAATNEFQLRDALAETASAAPYLVSVDRPAESLQPQLTYVRGFHPLFNGAKRPLTDHDLARLCLAAEPRRKIDDP